MIIFIIIYAAFLILGIFLWIIEKEPAFVKNPSNQIISAIVVVRNEDENIANLLDSFERQTYQNFEIIIVDDNSTDQTVNIIEKHPEFGKRLRLLKLVNRGNSPKKNGIELAIENAKGEIIFTTDGDCILSPKILEVYANIFQNSNTKMLIGPVTFFEENSLWNSLQIVEFASLSGSSAIAAFLNAPIMSSAANLAYRKSVFLEVGAYADNAGLASGDDEFLMNKISNRYPKSTKYVKSDECVVETKACTTWNEFYNQRKRWAGKWSKSFNWVSRVTAVFIFLVNAVTLYYFATFNWQILLIRFMPEVVFLALVITFLKKRKEIKFIPVCQILYPFYAVFFGLVSFKPSHYIWKDRKLK